MTHKHCPAEYSRKASLQTQLLDPEFQLEPLGQLQLQSAALWVDPDGQELRFRQRHWPAEYWRWASVHSQAFDPAFQVEPAGHWHPQVEVFRVAPVGQAAKSERRHRHLRKIVSKDHHRTQAVPPALSVVPAGHALQRQVLVLRVVPVGHAWKNYCGKRKWCRKAALRIIANAGSAPRIKRRSGRAGAAEAG